MRIAVCLYGLVGSTGKKYGQGKSLNPKIAFNLYKKNFFKQYKNLDIFIHSTSKNFEKKIVKIYKPKDYLIEYSKNFTYKIFLHRQFLFFLITLPIQIFIKKNAFSKFVGKFKMVKNSYSRYYSMYKVVQLKKNYEEKNKLKYDYVFLGRLDWSFFTPVKISNKMRGKFVLSHNNDIPSPRDNYTDKLKRNNNISKGLACDWFISSSNNINKYSSLFFKYKYYFVSPHMCSKQHCEKLKLKYFFYKYRVYDHNAIRRISKSEE
tara:strand:- start:534 stop:1322 length:789 start_codon:yes stop_codon:yes gene_type:complete